MGYTSGNLGGSYSQEGARARFIVLACMTMQLYLPDYQQISAALDSYLEQDERLCVADNFVERVRAIDFLEIQMIDELEQMDNSGLSDAQRLSLIERARALKQKLDGANEKLFSQLLASIRSNDRSALKQVLRSAEQQILPKTGEEDIGYDEMDSLVMGLLDVALAPDAPQERDPELIVYQPTPARIILKIIGLLHITAGDVFYDLGSGIGHVPIMVHLLTDIRTKGVELEESYFRYSTQCQKKLGLSGVEFINADARAVDYDDGTIFYLYTPFQGEVLRQVLGKLEAQSKRRPIRVCAHGPCALQVLKEDWLVPTYQTGIEEGCLVVFVSR